MSLSPMTTAHFSPECILQCVLKFCSSENDFEDWLQGYGLSLEWILKCFFKLPLSEKAFWHWFHWNGFSLEWVLKWFFIFPFTEKAFMHWLQRYGLSPEWIPKCFFKLPFYIKTVGIDCKEMSFPLNEFSNVHFLKKLLSIDYKRMFDEQDFNEK